MADRIVAEHLTGLQPKGRWAEPVHRLALAVQRLALDEHRAQQHEQCLRIGQPHPPIEGRHEALQQGFEPEALQEVVHERQGTQALALKAERLGGPVSDLTVLHLATI